MNRPILVTILVGIGFALAMRARASSSIPPPTIKPVDTPPLPDPGTVNEGFRNGLFRVRAAFGDNVARNTERLYRHETRNLGSGQFLKTFTPGMHAFKLNFPWGWSLADAGFKADQFRPLVTMKANVIPGAIADPNDQWIAFKRLDDAVFYVGWYINKYGPARWNGGQDPAYMAKLEATPTPTLSSLA